jgi:hypothetical protein
MFTCCMLVTVYVAEAKEGVIQCANLIYGGNHTSKCFSDEFLSQVQKKTTIPTERRFKSVKLASEELFKYPFVMMTGEARFYLTNKERANLKKYLKSGGFLLASAGCSNKDWDRCFRREMKAIYKSKPASDGKKAKASGKDVEKGEAVKVEKKDEKVLGLKKIEMKHPLFKTVSEIKKLKLHHAGEDARLEGVEADGKLVVIYSPHGLNDTSHTEGCCCCGGNEIENSLEVNVNIFVYALLH